MQAFGTAGGLIITLVLIMAAGFTARKTGLMPLHAVDSMSKMVVYVTMPCFIFNAMILEGSGDALGNIPTMFLISAVFFVFVTIVCKWVFMRVKDAEQARIYKLGFIFPNVGFMGIPVIEALFGTRAVLYAAIVNVVFTVFVSILPELMYGGRNLNLKKILHAVFSPMMIAVFLGSAVFLLHIPMPASINRALVLLGNMSTPMAFMVIGSRFVDVKWQHFKNIGIYYLSAFRLLILPVATYFVLTALKVDTLMVQTMSMMAGMPIAAMVITYVQVQKGDAAYASVCIALTHLFSFITVPIIAMLLL